MKNILALDLGTNCGYACGNGNSHFSGVWNLRPGRYEGGGMRFVKFRKNLNDFVDAYKTIDGVFFEEVRRHRGTDAAHVYGGLMATLTAWCEEKKIPYEGVPVGAIKKFATGKGNADKPMMIAAAQSWGYEPEDDNEADAIAILRLKLKEFGLLVEGVPV